MVDNLAQQTANQIVDKVVSSDPNKVEDSYALLATKLYTDVYNSDPSPKAAKAFLDDVFQDINAQYSDGKSVPKDLALAWANQQLGHELPATGFDQNDLKNIISSTDPAVTVLDKTMANAIIDQYGNLQHEVQNQAMDRILAAHECTEDKQSLADYIKQWGNPDPSGLGGLLITEAHCSDTVTFDDRERMAGVVRAIPAEELQSRLKDLDASKPMEMPF